MSDFHQVIDGSEFVALLSDSRTGGSVERVIVRGAVHGQGQTFSRPIRINAVIFEGAVDLSDAVFTRGIEMVGCTFNLNVSLRNARVDGDLHLDDVRVIDKSALFGKYLPQSKGLDLSGVTVTKNVTIRWLQARRDVHAEEMKVGASLRIIGSSFDGALHLKDCEVSGSCLLGSEVVTDGDSVGGRAGFINGDLDVSNSRVVGSMVLTGIQVTGSVSMWGCRFGSSVFIQPAEGVEEKEGHRMAKSIGSLHVRGDLNLAASRIQGHLQIMGAVVEGAVRLFSIESGSTSLDPFAGGEAHRADPTLFGPCRFGSLQLDNSRIRGPLSMRSIVISGPLRKEETAGLSMTNAMVEGNVSFWRPDWAPMGPDPLSSLQDGGVIAGNLNGSGATIRGSIDLTNLDVMGATDFRNCEVGGAIEFRSASTLLEAQALPPEVRSHLLNGGSIRRASTVSLDLGMCKCQHDIDLTGLDLPDEWLDEMGSRIGFVEKRRYGSIYAPSLAVRGQVRLHAAYQVPGSPSRRIEDSALVPGSANFKDLNAGGFSASTKSFPHDPKDDKEPGEMGSAEEVGISLAGANISELRLSPDMSERSLWDRVLGRTKTLFPRPLDLGEMAVGSWGIHDGDLAEKFRALLNSDQEFRHDTYLRIEGFLSNAGHSREAGAIYRAAQDRAREMAWEEIRRSPFRIPRSILRALLEVFVLVPFKWLLGYGTAPWRLLFVMFFIWVVMLPFYRAPENFSPSLEYQQTESGQGLTVDSHPPADSWTLSSAAVISLRYHFPIVSLVAREEWKLAPRDGIHLANPFWGDGSSIRVASGRPEDLGLTMAILNWALWPLVLSFLVRKVIRSRMS